MYRLSSAWLLIFAVVVLFVVAPLVFAVMKFGIMQMLSVLLVVPIALLFVVWAAHGSGPKQ